MLHRHLKLPLILSIALLSACTAVPPAPSAPAIQRDAHGHIERSQAARAAFKREHPCLTCPALFVPSELIEIGLERSLEMRKKRPTPEQIVTLLRQIEVATSQGKSIAIACREAGISDQSYYRWRKEYGGLDLDQARRMKDLEKENSRLKRLVADLSLEKQVLKDIASGNL
jgi:transposase-like protein